MLNVAVGLCVLFNPGRRQDKAKARRPAIAELSPLSLSVVLHGEQIAALSPTPSHTRPWNTVQAQPSPPTPCLYLNLPCPQLPPPSSHTHTHTHTHALKHPHHTVLSSINHNPALLFVPADS